MTPLEQLARDLAATPAAGDATPFSLPDGVTHEPGERLALRFDPPVDARALAAAFGWPRALAYSSDVEPRRWRIGLHEGQADDPQGGRVALVAPRLGDWRVRVELEGRPEGEVSKIVAGASPTYDLERVAARVVRLELVDTEL